MGNYKKGEIVRRQKYGEQIKLYRSAKDIEDENFDLKFLSYFGHSVPGYLFLLVFVTSFHIICLLSCRRDFHSHFSLITVTYSFHFPPFDNDRTENSPACFQNCICMNFPPMYTNHSRDPNVSMHYSTTEKLTVLERDVIDGEEMVQDYAEYSEVKWFEDLLVEKGVKQSIRQFGIEFNQTQNHDTMITTQQ